MLNVGDRIRKRRLELGLTQDELAKKMGYSGRSSVCSAEKWGGELTTEKVKHYAEALDCSVEYLLGWTDAQLEWNPETQEMALKDEYEYSFTTLIRTYSKLVNKNRKYKELVEKCLQVKPENIEKAITALSLFE